MRAPVQELRTMAQLPQISSNRSIMDDRSKAILHKYRSYYGSTPSPKKHVTRYPPLAQQPSPGPTSYVPTSPPPMLMLYSFIDNLPAGSPYPFNTEIFVQSSLTYRGALKYVTVDVVESGVTSHRTEKQLVAPENRAHCTYNGYVTLDGTRVLCTVWTRKTLVGWLGLRLNDEGELEDRVQVKTPEGKDGERNIKKRKLREDETLHKGYEGGTGDCFEISAQVAAGNGGKRQQKCKEHSTENTKKKKIGDKTSCHATEARVHEWADTLVRDASRSENEPHEQSTKWLYSAAVTVQRDGKEHSITVRVPMRIVLQNGVSYEMEPGWDEVVNALKIEVQRRNIMHWFANRTREVLGASTTIQNVTHATGST